MEKLAVAVQQRGVRLIDFFRAQDRLRSGTIARTMFHRVLASALDITSIVTTPELRGIEAQFSFDTDKFYYEKFIAGLDKILSDSNKTADTSFTRTTEGNVRTVVSHNPKDSAELQKLEAELIAKIDAERIDLLTCFRSFDQRRTGRVLKSRFIRCFPFRVPDRLSELVCQRYAVANGEIDYSSWLAHLRLPAGMGSDSFKTDEGHRNSPKRVTQTDLSSSSPQRALLHSGLTVSAARASNRPVPRTVEEIVGDIGDAVKRIGSRIIDFIQDRDPARSGLVPIPGFESALGRLHIPNLILDSNAVDALVEEYKTRAPISNDWRIDYRRFCRDVDAATQGGVGTAQGSQGVRNIARSPRRNELDDKEMSRVNIVVERIRDAVRARRINMFPCFRDFDKVNGGTSGNRTCTVNRFARALTVNGINVAEDDTKLLARYFAVKTPGEYNSDAIDYEAFCNMVHDQDKADALEEAERNQRSAASRTAAADSTRQAFYKPLLEQHELDDILDALANQVNKRQVRLLTFFQDFDHHKSGAIHAQKFQSTLATCKIQMQQSDIDSLKQYYAHPTLPETVCYIRLLDDLQDRPVKPSAVLARAVNGPFAPPTKTNAEALQSLEEEHNDPEAQERVAAIVARVKECVRTRGILLPPFFVDYDKNKMGLITRTQFIQTLARHPLPLAAQDCDLLSTHFSDASVPTHVRWKDFVAAVDDIENPELVRSAAARERAELQARLDRSQAALEASQRASAQTVIENNWQPKSVFATSADSTGVVAAMDKSIDALDQLFKIVMTRRVRVQEFLNADTVDPLRHGTAKTDRFLSALNMCGLRLPADLGEALVERYKTSRGEVDYVRFLHDLDDAENSAQEERTHGLNVTTRLTAGRDKLFKAMEANPALKATVEQIKRVAAARRLQTRPVFEAHDKLRIGTVTEAQFLNSLSGPLTIHLEPRQSRALLNALQVPQDPRSLASSNPILGAVVAYEGFSSIIDQ